MKVGDYVRTEYGIAKIEQISCGEDLWFDNDNIFEDEETAHNYKLNPPSMYGSWAKDNIIKSSPNIIDLIEVGDYVNGYLVKDIDYAFDDIIMNKKNARYVPYIDCNKNNYIDDIESIVTKEQFESMKYKVVE